MLIIIYNINNLSFIKNFIFIDFHYYIKLIFNILNLTKYIFFLYSNNLYI